MKKSLLLLILFVSFNCFPLSEEARVKGFVYLHEVDPTIQVSVRYATHENFLGTLVDGYKKPVILLTKQAASALKKVQDSVKKDGYSLVVYDGYRPQRAVNHFVRWGKNIAEQSKKSYYYPRVDKAKTFELGYVPDKRSGHTRGSTVDLTLIKRGNVLHPVQEKERTLLDGSKIKFLDDGTVDMGSSFDLFDTASHYQNDLLESVFKERRAYLRKRMEEGGFKAYEREWWHFRLNNEPFPEDQESSYFDFLVE